MFERNTDVIVSVKPYLWHDNSKFKGILPNCQFFVDGRIILRKT